MTDYLPEFIRPGLPSVAVVIVFGMTFIDGMVLLGLFSNGLALVVCTYLYSNGIITVLDIVFWGFLGVFLAEQLSFWVGLRYGEPVLEAALSVAPQLERAKRKRKWQLLLFWVSEQSWRNSLETVKRKIIIIGSLAVLLGRWSPVAALVPATCAVLSMRYSQFIVASALACIIWSSCGAMMVYAGANGTAALYQHLMGF